MEHGVPGKQLNNMLAVLDGELTDARGCFLPHMATPSSNRTP